MNTDPTKAPYMYAGGNPRPCDTAEIAQLRAERDEALAVLREIAVDDPWETEIAGPDTCHYCWAREPDHGDECPWVAARALLERTDV